MTPTLTPAHETDRGERFVCVSREKDGRSRRVLLALVRQRHDGTERWLVRTVIGGGESAGLGRRGDHAPTDERGAHALYEQILHRYLARGYREDAELVDAERWWLASWGFAIAQIDHRLVPVAAALVAVRSQDELRPLEDQGWRAYGQASPMGSLARAFLLVDAEQTITLFGEAMQPQPLDARTRELGERLIAGGLAPCALEIGRGSGIDPALVLFDIYQVRDQATGQLARPERGLLLDEIIAAVERPGRAITVRRPVELTRPLAPCWLVAPDGGQACWIA